MNAYKKRIPGMECLEAEVEALRAKCASLEEARVRGDAVGLAVCQVCVVGRDERSGRGKGRWGWGGAGGSA